MMTGLSEMSRARGTSGRGSPQLPAPSSASQWPEHPVLQVGPSPDSAGAELGSGLSTSCRRYSKGSSLSQPGCPSSAGSLGLGCSVRGRVLSATSCSGLGSITSSSARLNFSEGSAKPFQGLS